MLRPLPLTLYVALAVALAGCIPPDSGTGDGGPDSGTSATGTVGQQCIRMYTALCNNAIDNCDFAGVSLADCVQNGETACCMDQCAAAAVTPDDVVAECVTALSMEDCNSVAQSLTPAECSGVPAL